MKIPIRAWFLTLLSAVLAISPAISTPSATGHAVSIHPAPPALVAWISEVLSSHPRLRGQLAMRAAGQARARGAARPVYNPELALDYENTDINTGTIELGQSIDIYGKRQSRSNVAQAEVAVDEFQIDRVSEALAGELLTRFVDYESARAALKSAERIIDVLGRFAALAKERSLSGDIGTLEVELAELAHLEAIIAATAERTAIGEAEGALRSLTGMGLPDVQLGETPPGVLPVPGPVSVLVASHPATLVARGESTTAMAAIRQAEADRREDPTIGLRVGREGKENLLGLQLVIPLAVRNNRRAQVEAAKAQSGVSAEAFLALERELRGSIEAAGARYRTLKSTWALWQDRGAPRVGEQLQLLERLWRSGEQSTADYLVQLRQVLATQRSVSALRGELWQAWAAWLQAAGQVQDWMGMGRGNVR